MEIKTYNCYNEKNELENDPKVLINIQYERMNSVIKYLSELKSEFVEEYIQHLTKRIKKAVESIEKREGMYDFSDLYEKYNFLDSYQELKKLTKEFTLKHLNPIRTKEEDPLVYQVLGYNRAMAFERLSYHRVKSFVELLGKNEGIELYTKILTKIVEDLKQKHPQQEDVTITKNHKNAIDAWCKIGLCDFTYKVLDEHMIIYRFDKCFTHEVLKYFNDPDIAYYASSFQGDLPTRNDGLIIPMRRTQTLHHGDFCDELYWDSRVHKVPEQPSLEFTRAMKEE